MGYLTVVLSIAGFLSYKGGWPGGLHVCIIFGIFAALMLMADFIKPPIPHIQQSLAYQDRYRWFNLSVNQRRRNRTQKQKELVRQLRKEQEDALRTGKKKCPRCGGDMVLRKGKSGPFYGCSNYPKCTCTRTQSFYME